MSFIHSVMTLFKDCIFFKKTQPSIEIDVIVVKKYVFLNFVEKYVRLTWKNKVNVTIAIIIDYAWICVNKQGSEYASGRKYVKILNMAKFWIWQGSQNESVKQRTEYVLTEFWIYLGF